MRCEKIKVGPIIKQSEFVVKLKLTGVWLAVIRLRVAAYIIKLACVIGGVGCKIDGFTHGHERE